MGKRRKRCSTSTHVEAADHKPLHKAEHNSETDVNPKKRIKKYEIKEMKKLRKSIEEMTETMKKLQEMLMNKAPAPSSSTKEEPQEKKNGLAKDECCFKTEDSDGDDSSSIFVRGINTCLAREDIKSALRKHFESGGCQVSRVFVPIECQTGVPLGYAFVDVDDMEKALQLGGGWMGGRMFLVMMAQYQKESISFPNFDGCQDCGDYLFERRQKRFLARP